MKQSMALKTILAAFFLSCSLLSYAPPPPPPGDHGGGGDVPAGGGAPLGEGIALLIGLASAWSARKLYQIKKSENHEA